MNSFHAKGALREVLKGIFKSVVFNVAYLGAEQIVIMFIKKAEATDDNAYELRVEVEDEGVCIEFTLPSVPESAFHAVRNIIIETYKNTVIKSDVDNFDKVFSGEELNYNVPVVLANNPAFLLAEYFVLSREMITFDNVTAPSKETFLNGIIIEPAVKE